MSNAAPLIAILALVTVVHVQAHSWIACSDYTEKNGADWDPKKCRGFPRDASQYAQKDSFGHDRGFDHKPGSSGAACKTSLSAGSYSSEYPKAVYYRGQQVILAHPMKNHGADDGCTSRYIPDNGNALYRGRRGTDTHKTLSYYKAFLVSDLGTSKFGHEYTTSTVYPKPGYQNAPNFCKNTDRAMGTYSFNVPSDLQDGDYTFVWRWAFNSKDDIYTTCFDVQIVNSKAARDSVLQARGQNNFYVACGGTLSNLGPGSTVGCNGVTPPTLPATTTKTTTRATTTTTPRPVTTTKATTIGPDGSRNVPMSIFQLTGDVSLGFPRSGVSRRFVFVHFDCEVVVSFWNARLLSANNGHFELMQENPSHVSSGKIFYSATFPQGCPVTTVPHAMLRRDE